MYELGDAQVATRLKEFGLHDLSPDWDSVQLCLFKLGYILFTVSPFSSWEKEKKQVNGGCIQEAFDTVSEKQFFFP